MAFISHPHSSYSLRSSDATHPAVLQTHPALSHLFPLPVMLLLHYYEYMNPSFKNHLFFKPQLKCLVHRGGFLEHTTIYGSFIHVFTCLLLISLSGNDKNSTRSRIVFILFIILTHSSCSINVCWVIV